MSSIAGILCFDRAPTEAEPAERMAAALAWRGPDDDGSYRSPDGRTALACHRLATVDGSASASQPLANETHDVWLVLDGEILNHRTLRHSLELVGHRFRSSSDAEVALHAYEQWDLDFLTHLQGAFALALWDDRRDRLVLARDRLGRKPLFYAEHRGKLAFASGIKPLLDELALPRRLDLAAAASFLRLGVVPAPATLAAGVAKLAPGERMVVERFTPPRREIWGHAEPEERRAQTLRSLPADRHAGNLRTLLECSVADRLMGDAPPALWLSPAAPFAAIAAIINRLTGLPPKVLAVHAGADSEAARLMRQAAQAAGTELQEVEIGAGDLAAALPALAGMLGEPVADTTLAAAFFAARAAAGHAPGGLLADIGAQETLLCAPAYDPARRGTLAHHLARLLRRRPALPPVPPLSARPFPQMDGAAVLAQVAPPPLEPALSAPVWYGDDPLAALGLADLRLRVGDGTAPALDAIAQGHGLEARLPFLDDALLNYALAVPGPVRSPTRNPRFMLRRLMADLVPAELLARSQAPAVLPLSHWLAGPLGDMLQGGDLLAADKVSALLAAHRAGTDHTEGLWALLLLSHWCAALGIREAAEARADPFLAESAT